MAMKLAGDLPLPSGPFPVPSAGWYPGKGVAEEQTLPTSTLYFLWGSERLGMMGLFLYAMDLERRVTAAVGRGPVCGGVNWAVQRSEVFILFPASIP